MNSSQEQNPAVNQGGHVSFNSSWSGGRVNEIHAQEKKEIIFRRTLAIIHVFKVRHMAMTKNDVVIVKQQMLETWNKIRKRWRHSVGWTASVDEETFFVNDLSSELKIALLSRIEWVTTNHQFIILGSIFVVVESVHTTEQGHRGEFWQRSSWDIGKCCTQQGC